MKINSKELSVHDGAIYYDHVKIRDYDLNEYTNLNFWEEYLPKHPEFCGCKYHKMMWGHCDQSKHLLEQSKEF